MKTASNGRPSRTRPTLVPLAGGANSFSGVVFPCGGRRGLEVLAPPVPAAPGQAGDRVVVDEMASACGVRRVLGLGLASDAVVLRPVGDAEFLVVRVRLVHPALAAVGHVAYDPR